MPHAKIISNDTVALRPVVQALNAAGWNVAAEADAAALVVIDLRGGKGDVTTSWPPGTIVFAVAGAPGDKTHDLALEFPFYRPALDRISAAWSPPSTAPLDRLREGFGTAALRPLVEGLRRELTTALADETLAAHAHRYAGLSGTLGFTELSGTLEPLSRGQAHLMKDACRHAKTALAAIDDWLRANA